MSKVNPDRLEIVVVGHTRKPLLQQTLKMWHATTPYRAMYVIANHPDTLGGIELPPRTIPLQTARIPQHAGQLSESWNLALLWTFVQRQDLDWVILSQDDVQIHPGWLDLVNRHDFDFYNAPAGDMVMLMSRQAWIKVGWFDEHVRTIGGQDLDWISRAVVTLGEHRISSEDHHGWSYNPIGLAKYWESSYGGGAPGASYFVNGVVDAALKNALRAKWGVTTQELHNLLIAHRVPTPAHGEYDWYPWIVRQ